MYIILEILLLFMITLSILGLLWALFKDKPAQKWMFRLMISLLVLITFAALENTVLVTQETKETAVRHQGQQQAANIQNEKSTKLHDFVPQQINQATTAAEINKQYINKAESTVQTEFNRWKAKIDNLIEYIRLVSK